MSVDGSDVPLALLFLDELALRSSYFLFGQ
jgi:hypothetical protein